MIDFIKKNLFLFLLVLSCLFYFQKTIISDLLPIPSDTIVGLYYPFRDIYANNYPRGIPFKNFLITDPVRQTYPWKNLVIDAGKKLELPIWNPYNFSGTPLLANFQSSAFYPLNFLYFFLPFKNAWSFLIILQPILAGFFMFLYLENLKLKKEACLLGAITFSFSGFFVAWMEWGNILNTALWLPLILLSIDKITIGIINKEAAIMSKKVGVWCLILVITLISSFFAGHLQTFFYMYVLSSLYFMVRLFEQKNKGKLLLTYIIINALFLLITFVQWYPSLQFILLSARDADLIGYKNTGWFIPWQNLVQFVAPDFFGNPATLNYTGIWNYAEFVGYVGIFPLLAALFAVFFRRDKKTILFFLILLISLIFALPTQISKIPFVLHIPFLSTAQPTRLIFVIDFSLAVLAALGFDYYTKQKKNIIYLISGASFVFIGLWIFVLFGSFGIFTQDQVMVARQNLFLPTFIFSVIYVIFIILRFTYKIKNPKIDYLFFSILLILTFFDLIRFGWKFEPFTNKEYLFPSTRVLSYLQNQSGLFRVMSTDSQILPPNFSVMYHLQTVDGYDPLYLMRYGEFASATSRNKADISTPFGFNRIITLQDTKSRLTDFLGVRFVLSSSILHDDKLTPVLSEGHVNVYENTLAFPRAFFVSSTIPARDKQSAINAIFDPNNLLNHVAVVENSGNDSRFKKSWETGLVKINEYSANKIILVSTNKGEGFLVLTDVYYPTWKVKIDGEAGRIYLTDYTFRGIVVPSGTHTIEFYDSLL